MSAAACLSQSLRLSSTLKMEEEAINIKKQGIGSILGSDSERGKWSSLRRTLSADMSSTKWVAQHGFSPMKKIASSEEFSSVSSITGSDDEEEDEAPSQLDIWNSIQRDKHNNNNENNKALEKSSQSFDMWSCILSQKEQEDPNIKSLPPYIPPLVKRSASSLSEKSLEICTERLGSETGSDGFSSYSSSDVEEDKDMEQEQLLQQQQVDKDMDIFDVEDIQIPKYNYVAGKKCSPQRSFPPPIPSLSARVDGASIRMQSRRDNGKLVLEAVSVAPTNNFRAQRQDGRLVLTFIDTEQEPTSKQDAEEEEEEKVDVSGYFEEEEKANEDDDEVDEDTEEEEEEEEEEEMEMEFMMEQGPRSSSGVISLHRLTLMMKNKQVDTVANQNPAWANKFNEVVIESDKPTMVAQSLPPPPRMSRLVPKRPVKAAAATTTTTVAATAGASFNAYEYYWRPKPESITQSKSTNGKLMINSRNPMANYEQKELLASRGNKGESLVPFLKSCKEPRRCLLFWEPHCIATS